MEITWLYFFILWDIHDGKTILKPFFDIYLLEHILIIFISDKIKMADSFNRWKKLYFISALRIQWKKNTQIPKISKYKLKIVFCLLNALNFIKATI